MKNNIIYLRKFHIASNDEENLSYCGQKCNDNNSVFMLEMSDKNNICPTCLEIISKLSCSNCLCNDNGYCEPMNSSVHEKQTACYMHIKK